MRINMRLMSVERQLGNLYLFEFDFPRQWFVISLNMKFERVINYYTCERKTYLTEPFLYTSKQIAFN